jgi:hypothetical protein
MSAGRWWPLGRLAATVGLLGKDGGDIAGIVDLNITIPRWRRRHRSHATIIHIVCDEVEKALVHPMRELEVLVSSSSPPQPPKLRHSGNQRPRPGLAADRPDRMTMDLTAAEFKTP